MSNPAESPQSPPLLVPIAEVARLDSSWPWSIDQTYRLIKAGRLSCVRVGRRVFLRRADLEAFVSMHVVTGGAR